MTLQTFFQRYTNRQDVHEKDTQHFYSSEKNINYNDMPHHAHKYVYS